jgi:hypothetical protein
VDLGYGARGSRGASLALPAGSGAEPQSTTRGMGERCELPSRVCGEAPAENELCDLKSVKNELL